MSPNRELHQAWQEQLNWDCSLYEDSDILYQEGLEKLAIHWENFDEMGAAPKQLQLPGMIFHNHSGKISELEGLQTSFKSLSKIIPTPPMSMEELKVADEVVDEWKALGYSMSPKMIVGHQLM